MRLPNVPPPPKKKNSSVPVISRFQLKGESRETFDTIVSTKFLFYSHFDLGVRAAAVQPPHSYCPMFWQILFSCLWGLTYPYSSNLNYSLTLLPARLTMPNGSCSSRSKFCQSAHPAVTLDLSGNRWPRGLSPVFFLHCLSAASLKCVTNAKYPFHTEEIDGKQLETQREVKTVNFC
jgi:hypothetical protein